MNLLANFRTAAQAPHLQDWGAGYNVDATFNLLRRNVAEYQHLINQNQPLGPNLNSTATRDWQRNDRRGHASIPGGLPSISNPLPLPNPVSGLPLPLPLPPILNGGSPNPSLPGSPREEEGNINYDEEDSWDNSQIDSDIDEANYSGGGTTGGEEYDTDGSAGWNDQNNTWESATWENDRYAE